MLIISYQKKLENLKNESDSLKSIYTTLWESNV